MATKRTKKSAGFNLSGNMLNPTSKVHDADKRDGDRVGISTGLNLTHFVNELYLRNYADKLTDEELAAAMLAEFPNRQTIQAPSAYRGYFNGGKHGHGQGNGQALPPENRLPRFKATEDGEIVAGTIRGLGDGAKKGKKPAKVSKAAAAASKPKRAPKAATKRATGTKVAGTKRAPRRKKAAAAS